MQQTSIILQTHIKYTGNTSALSAHPMLMLKIYLFHTRCLEDQVHKQFVSIFVTLGLLDRAQAGDMMIEMILHSLFSV